MNKKVNFSKAALLLIMLITTALSIFTIQNLLIFAINVFIFATAAVILLFINLKELYNLKQELETRFSEVEIVVTDILLLYQRLNSMSMTITEFLQLEEKEIKNLITKAIEDEDYETANLFQKYLLFKKTQK